MLAQSRLWPRALYTCQHSLIDVCCTGLELELFHRFLQSLRPPSVSCKCITISCKVFDWFQVRSCGGCSIKISVVYLALTYQSYFLRSSWPLSPLTLVGSFVWCFELPSPVGFYWVRAAFCSFSGIIKVISHRYIVLSFIIISFYLRPSLCS